jgi:hydrogenase nickel incorporation protein HypA/HybF
MTDLIGKIEEVARADDTERVTRVAVRLGALSHFTPEHFVEHFVDASTGTIAEGAEVDAVSDGDVNAASAAGVVLESVEVEVRARAEAR